MNTYRFISDPGHGWLEVPLAEVVRLGLTNRISRYSYQHKNMAYLEEDCDAALFMEAKKNRGEPVKFEEVYQERTPIRTYRDFGGVFLS